MDWELVHSRLGCGKRTLLDYEQSLFFLSPSSEMRGTRVEREKRDRREREGWLEGGEQKGENPLFSIEDQETTGDKSARQTATQPQMKLKGWPDPACLTNVSPYKHFGWSSWVNSVLKLSQGKIIRACAIAVLDNRSMRFSFKLGQWDQLFSRKVNAR